MSKYTEAETKIKKIMCEEIDRLPSHFDGEDEVYDSTKDVDEILKLNKTVCKSLQIADRLEQADGEKSIEKNLCSKCPYRNECWIDCDVKANMLNGYNQALAYVRGDNE